MNSKEFKSNICRICLEENACLDWNTPLYQFYETTYKDCYYKYSQLECFVRDPFPQMLCQSCSNALHSTHALILKALESHKLLLNEFKVNAHVVEELKSSTNYSRFGDIYFTPSEFESVLVEKIEVEPIIDSHFEYDKSSEKDVKAFIASAEEVQKTQVSVAREKFKTEDETKIVEEPLNEPSNNSIEMNVSSTEPRRKCTPRVRREKATKNKREDTELTKIEPNVKKKYKETKKPGMCSICSKILQNKYLLQMHEKTHIENRERKETCRVCGLKFYDKRNLYAHMRIHKENREKRHKCEFCSKAFYNKGDLNIHQRIHSGQMVPCSLCSKEFFRQIDLDRHMTLHSATTINSETKKRSRYVVRCKYCEKSMLSTSFKSHIAAHLNEPLMKCLICDKEFFRRESCVLHVKKVHQKNNSEYNDFIVIYKKNRMSHLFFEQKAEIQVDID